MELLFQTQNLIAWGGVFIILLLIFAETGFLLGLVVPGGETLVFTAGFLTSTGALNIEIIPFFLLMILASFLGDTSGYFIGKKLGPKLFEKEDAWYFKKKYVIMTQDYMKRHKRKALVLGKFFPVIRPFLPVLSGISGLRKSQFFTLSFLSILVYLGTFLFAGYFLGSRFPGLKDYLGLILPVTVVILLVPVLVQLRKSRKKQGSETSLHKKENEPVSGS
ncbi:MAG TPA: DedA family protein [Flavisolibacter sp.]|nr:DedA family protein [Flavisolibacter sp.]